MNYTYIHIYIIYTHIYIWLYMYIHINTSLSITNSLPRRPAVSISKTVATAWWSLPPEPRSCMATTVLLPGAPRDGLKKTWDDLFIWGYRWFIRWVFYVIYGWIIGDVTGDLYCDLCDLYGDLWVIYMYGKKHRHIRWLNMVIEHGEIWVLRIEIYVVIWWFIGDLRVFDRNWLIFDWYCQQGVMILWVYVYGRDWQGMPLFQLGYTPHKYGF